MHDRTSLGPADVSDAELARTVARLLRADPDDLVLLDSRAEEFPYDLPAITTLSRSWVHGTATVRGETRPWRMFVKHVQSWTRHPFFAFVPEEHREVAAAGVPWRTEPAVYASDLGSHLPDGLSMPRALRIDELDELSAAIWLEAVEVVEPVWDGSRMRHVARLLGELAAAPAVRRIATSAGHGMSILDYVHGRLAIQVLPALRDPALWQHPLVAHAFDAELRARLLTAADAAERLGEELMALPRLASHGDACPNNLLSHGGPDVVMIDFGFFGLAPVGYDLAQLLVGDVQVGRRSSADLAELERIVVPAYVEGLAAQGVDVHPDVVRRAHAVQLLIFTGLSSVPLEMLGGGVDDALLHVAEERAAISRFSLDLLDATGGLP